MSGPFVSLKFWQEGLQVFHDAIIRRDARLADLEARLALIDGKKAKIPPPAGIIHKVRNPDEH